MTDTMVEQVARALAWQHALDEGYSDAEARDWAYTSSDAWRDHVDYARAAIAAMREPTEVMMRTTGYRPVGAGDGATYTIDARPPRQMRQAMIDAALEEAK